MPEEYYLITLEAIDKGLLSGALLRATAPLTIQAMYKKMREKFIAGRARWFDFTNKSALYFDINIKRGKEGKPTQLKAKELGYIYKLDSVVLAFEDDPEIPYEVMKIGVITDELDAFKDITNGTSVKMKLM